MTSLFKVAIAILASLAAFGCRTTSHRSTSEQVHGGGVSDGPNMKGVSQESRVRNAFGAFMY